MRKLFFAIFALLFFFNFTFIQAQKNLKYVPIDSLSGITIQKYVYYKEPILIKKGIYQDKCHNILWHKTDSILAEKSEGSLRFYQKRLAKNMEQIKKLKNDTSIQNKKAKFYLSYPYDYKFGEIWLKFNSTGENVIIVLNTIKQTESSSNLFGDPSLNNNESIDSTGVRSTPKAYIYEDGLLKIADQQYVFEKLNQNGDVVDLSLKGFKDALFRSSEYVRSVTKGGERRYETLTSSSSGFTVKGVSLTP